MRHTVQYSICTIAVIIFCTIILAFILPLGQAISPMFASTASSTAASAYSASSIVNIILYTFKESFLSVLIALLAGIPAAYFLSQKKLWICKVLTALSAVPLCIPPLIIALGYIATFGMAGYINRFLMNTFNLAEPPLRFLYSFWGIAITQGFYNFPLIMKTVADAWESLDKNQADSARLLGASSWRVFRTITIFQLLPSIVSACIPVFLYSFFSFMIVMLFGTIGGTTLEVAIFHAGRSILNFNSVALLALIETGCAFLVLFGYGFLEQKSFHSNGITLAQEYSKKDKLKRTEMIPAIIFFSIIALFFLMPLISIAVGSITSNGKSASITFVKWKKMLMHKSFYSALKNTCAISLCTACICTLAGFVYAVLLRLTANKKLSNMTAIALRTLPLLPMAVSSVVMGIGITRLVRRGSPLMLVLAQSALSWPFAFRQLYAPLQAIPQNIIDSARLLSRYKTDVIFKIMIPYCKKNIISSLGFCFAISAGDATLPLVLAIHKFDTLSLYTYRLAGSYRFGEACVCGLILGILCMTIFSVSKRK